MIEVEIDQIHIPTIKANEISKTTILTEDNISGSSFLCTVTILMYFMYKIYKKASEFIDGHI